MVAITTVQPADLPMNQALVVAVGRTLPAIFASWRTTVWVTLAFYLLVGMVVVFGLRVMQQNLRSQEQSLLDKDQALSNLWHAVLIATGQGVWDANCRPSRCIFPRPGKPNWATKDAQIGNTLAEWTMRIHPDDVGRTKAAWAECENGRDDYRLRVPPALPRRQLPLGAGQGAGAVARCAGAHCAHRRHEHRCLRRAAPAPSALSI